MAAADPKTTPNTDDAEKAKTTREMTAADAAKRVKRTVIEKGDDGKPVAKQAPVAASDVLAFRDYGAYVVVVTKDGQKLQG